MHRCCLTALAVAALLWPAVLAPGTRGQGKDPFAHWEKAIAAFERQDEKNPPPKDAIVFVGSSTIRLWDLPKHFPGLKVINRGFGGSQLADATHFAERLVIKHRPRVVVLYAGDNDIAAGKSPERVLADFKAFVKAIRAALPKAKIIFLSVKPSRSRWKLADVQRKANALVAAECQRDARLLYVDTFGPTLGEDGTPRPELFARDGLHLNDAGYRLWSKILRPHLQ